MKGIRKKRHYWHWFIDVQNDFQARMDWCVKSFKDANHPPVSLVSGNYKIVPGGLAQNVSPGNAVQLKGSASDLDKDRVSYKWWHYHDNDSASQVLNKNSGSQNASFKVPNQRGKGGQIILEVKDNNSLPLKHYQRLFFDIK